jgi:hypothetical protein
VRKQIPAVTPLIQGEATFNEHEGNVGKMVRVHDSETIIDYRRQEFEFALNRDEMRRFDLPAIQQKPTELARRSAKLRRNECSKSRGRLLIPFHRS